MDRADRSREILRLLTVEESLTVQQIAQSLKVSAVTIRRDLVWMDQDGLLIRTHGGAKRRSLRHDYSQRSDDAERSAQKRRIASAAVDLLTPSMTIGLSGGTTCTAIAEEICRRDRLVEDTPANQLTVVTNAINIAAQFISHPAVKVMVLGGVLRPKSFETIGPFSEMVLRQVSMDITFLGVNGLDPQRGATIHDEGEALINRLMAERSRKTVVVADSMKIGATTFATIGGAELFDTLITDSGISDTDRRTFLDLGIEVIAS